MFSMIFFYFSIQKIDDMPLLAVSDKGFREGIGTSEIDCVMLIKSFYTRIMKIRHLKNRSIIDQYFDFPLFWYFFKKSRTRFRLFQICLNQMAQNTQLLNCADRKSTRLNSSHV